LFLYTGAFFAFGVLIVVAIASSGYEPLAILSSNYNTTQHFWYYDFTPEIKRGPLCAPHVFSVGDTFQTSQGAFAWSLDYLTNAVSTATDPSVKAVNTQGVDYAGTPLLPGTCSVAALDVVADLASWTATTTASIKCLSNSTFPVSASTSFVSSAFIEKASLDQNRLLVPIGLDSSVEIENKWAAQVMLMISGLDVLTALRMNVNLLAPSVTSFAVKWAPKTGDPQCYSTVLPLSIDTIGFSNMTLINNGVAQGLFNSLYYTTTSNFMQTMMAAVNLDIGSPCPSFMTEPSLIQSQLYPTPGLLDSTASGYYASLATAYHTFWDTLQQGNAYLVQKYGFTFPLYNHDYVYVNASYLCHLNARKSVISLIIATITATYALFMTGWGVVMAAATWFASRPTDSNFCDGHVILEEQIKSLPTSPMGGPLGSPGYFQSMQIIPREPNAQTPMPKEVRDAKEEISEQSEKSDAGEKV
jgi:hypothetical protein